MTKKIINGKSYDTDEAQSVFTLTTNADGEETKTVLYKTPEKKFFLLLSDTEILPLTEAQAVYWIKSLMEGLGETLGRKDIFEKILQKLDLTS